MKEINLLASVALFSELYNNNNNDVSDILAEFIKGAIVSEKKWVINSKDLTQLLEKVYEFKIPESVVRTVVRNKLKNIAPKDINGFYVFNNSIEENFSSINEEYNSFLKIHKGILEGLILFIDSKQNIPLSDDEKNTVAKNFYNYLLDNNISDKYSKIISVFVIKNQIDKTFTDSLNLIREGLILYQGIRYTADINELGKWNTELTIFLSTEHLFSALGYNGSVFKQIFDDFYELVSLINAGKRNKYGETLIQLRYLEETKDQINAFFHTAELILQGTVQLDPSKSAMKEILNGCKNKSDIVAKKIKFESELKRIDISVREFNQNIYKYADYVVEDENVLSELEKEAKEKQKTFDEHLCRQFFRIFTKINYLRGGQNKTEFENIGYIFITENSFALYLAHQSKVKFGESDIPFAKGIDFITSKFWFKLKKGFGDRQSIPISFDVITKAQLILSAQLSQTIGQAFSKLVEQLRSGTLSREDALEMSYALREKSGKPEDINADNVEMSLDFLNDELKFEDLYRERSQREQELNDIKLEKEELKKEILRRDFIVAQQEEEKRMEREKIEEEEFILSQWISYKKSKNNDLFYFMVVQLSTTLPVLIALLLKSILPLWLTVALVLLSALELTGRSYLFNKERVKTGWLWFLTLVNKKKYNIELERRRKEYSELFRGSNGLTIEIIKEINS